MSINIQLREEIKQYLKKRLADEKKQASVISTYQLNSDELKEIKKLFPILRGFKINNIVNPEILGGLVIKLESKVIDLSIAGQLKKYRKIIGLVA